MCKRYPLSRKINLGLGVDLLDSRDNKGDKYE